MYLIVVRLVPSFGGDLSPQEKKAFSSYENFEGGKFVNRRNVPEKLSFRKFMELGYMFFTTEVKNGRPAQPLETVKIDPLALQTTAKTRLYWLGHSTFLIQHAGLNILIDPMFGDVPAPLDFLGSSRFNPELPIAPEDLPPIDYVLFSHDHYDHLDYGSVRKLKDKVEYFLMPLGMGNHLKRWGVSPQKIIELNWWESKAFSDIGFVCTPAQHFSGRKFSNGHETLWSSWVVQAEGLSLYFSGDSGYDIHFKTIGEKYGPFDWSLLECGQYNPMWPDVHMFPAETVQAAIDLNSKAFIPIHWGAFKLALHPWNEPALKVSAEAQKRGVKVAVPKIGQPIDFDYLPTDPPYWYE